MAELTTAEAVAAVLQSTPELAPANDNDPTAELPAADTQ
jgi:hypothetical protein